MSAVIPAGKLKVSLLLLGMSLLGLLCSAVQAHMPSLGNFSNLVLKAHSSVQ